MLAVCRPVYAASKLPFSMTQSPKGSRGTIKPHVHLARGHRIYTSIESILSTACRQVAAAAVGISRQSRLQPCRHRGDKRKDVPVPNHQWWHAGVSDGMLRGAQRDDHRCRCYAHQANQFWALCGPELGPKVMLSRQLRSSFGE